MELQQFIKTTLVQIANGIIAANEALADTSARVNPRNLIPAGEDQQHYGYVLQESEATKYKRPVETIEFDVALVATEESGSTGGIGVAIGFIGAGARGKSGETSSSESRVRFSVPMVLPSGGLAESEAITRSSDPDRHRLPPA